MPGLAPIGRLLVALGAAVALVGGVIWATSGLGLPGDLRFGTDRWGCYIPIATSVVLSIVLTIVLNLVLRLFGR